MSFSIGLSVDLLPRTVKEPYLLVGLGTDYEEQIMVGCEALAETDCEFHIRGFSDAAWPVDVGYDLSVFMGQYPQLVSGLRDRRRVDVDLYSQGIERTLEFHCREEPVKIRCVSRTSWTPKPDCEFIPYPDLEAMLVALATDFASALDGVGSPIVEAEPFASWRTGRV